MVSTVLSPYLIRKKLKNIVLCQRVTHEQRFTVLEYLFIILHIAAGIF